MDDLGEDFLAHTALAYDKYGQIGVCHLSRHLKCVVQCRRVADDTESVLYTLYIHVQAGVCLAATPISVACVQSVTFTST